MLEVEDPAGKDAKSRLVRLLDDKGAVLGEVIVGKKRFDAFGTNRSGTYVRRPGDPQSWLANADLDASIAIRDWVLPAVLEVPAAKISAVSIEIAGEPLLKIARDAAAGTAPKFALAGEPAGKKLKDNGAADGIARAVSAIDMEDVRKAPAASPVDIKPSMVKIDADGGVSISLRFLKEADGTWLAITATGPEGDAKKTADEITRRTQGWEFKVPAVKAQAILKRRSDLYEGS